MQHRHEHVSSSYQTPPRTSRTSASIDRSLPRAQNTSLSQCGRLWFGQVSGGQAQPPCRIFAASTNPTPYSAAKGVQRHRSRLRRASLCRMNTLMLTSSQFRRPRLDTIPRIATTAPKPRLSQPSRTQEDLARASRGGCTCLEEDSRKRGRTTIVYHTVCSTHRWACYQRGTTSKPAILSAGAADLAALGHYGWISQIPPVTSPTLSYELTSCTCHLRHAHP